MLEFLGNSKFLRNWSSIYPSWKLCISMCEMDNKMCMCIKYLPCTRWTHPYAKQMTSGLHLQLPKRPLIFPPDHWPPKFQSNSLTCCIDGSVLDTGLCTKYCATKLCETVGAEPGITAHQELRVSGRMYPKVKGIAPRSPDRRDPGWTSHRECCTKGCRKAAEWVTARRWSGNRVLRETQGTFRGQERSRRSTGRSGHMTRSMKRRREQARRVRNAGKRCLRFIQ